MNGMSLVAPGYCYFSSQWSSCFYWTFEHRDSDSSGRSLRFDLQFSQHCIKPITQLAASQEAATYQAQETADSREQSDGKERNCVPQMPKVFNELKEGVEIRNVDFPTFQENQFWKMLKLQLQKGKWLRIGPTGSGKANHHELITALWCGCRCYQPDGTDIREFDLWQFAK